MKKYLIFDLDGTLIRSTKTTTETIIKIVDKKYDIDKESFRYFLSVGQGYSLKKQLGDFLNINKNELEELSDYIYSEIIKSENVVFFPLVPEKIKELSKDYILFLSTGNSTTFAKNSLQKENIEKYFTKVIGSEEIAKGPEHIDIFKNLIDDENFTEKSVFIGDGENDRLISNYFKIDFIHIDENLENKYNDKYEIKSVSDIDEVLEKINLQI